MARLTGLEPATPGVTAQLPLRQGSQLGTFSAVKSAARAHKLTILLVQNALAQDQIVQPFNHLNVVPSHQ